MNYTLEIFRDTALSERVERLSLSAPSDARALEQAEAMRWKCECAGESRVLVLSRDGVEVARMGSRRLARPAFSIGDEVEFGTLHHDRLAGVVTDVDCGRSRAYDIMVDGTGHRRAVHVEAHR